MRRPVKAILLCLLLGAIAPPPQVILVRLIPAAIGRTHYPRAELFQCRGRNRIVATPRQALGAAMSRRTAVRTVVDAFAAHPAGGIHGSALGPGVGGSATASWFASRIPIPLRC
jgi:hypothetical protein